MDLGRLPDLYTNGDLDLILEIDNPETDLPEDLTGFTVDFVMKSDIALADADAEINKEAVIADQVTNKGEAVVQITAAEMQIQPGQYWYTVQATEPGGRQYPLVVRQVDVLQNPKSGS